MIEAGRDPELGEVAAGVAALARAVAALAETQGTHTALLLRLVDAAEREPKEGEELHWVLIRVALALEAQTEALARVSAELGRVGGEVEAAVARGVQRAGEAPR